MPQFTLQAVCETGKVLTTTLNDPDLIVLLVGMVSRVVPPETFVKMVTFIDPEYASQAKRLVLACLGHPA